MAVRPQYVVATLPVLKLQRLLTLLHFHTTVAVLQREEEFNYYFLPTSPLKIFFGLHLSFLQSRLLTSGCVTLNNKKKYG
jgi:hypothetical protein